MGNGYVERMDETKALKMVYGSIEISNRDKEHLEDKQKNLVTVSGK